jgi:branched-chain amino acid transport system ATP-binding protein
MLEVANLRAWHGPAQVVRGATFDVPLERVTAIVGPNGAGKTTLARTLAGLHRARDGSIVLSGRDLSNAGATQVARAGLTYVPQGRRLFASLTVAEHIGLARRRARPGAMQVDELLELFPHLERRMKVRARLLSGGEQQMLAIARAVLPGPEALVLDEPTEGLAPAVVELVGALIERLREQGVGVLLLEQQGRFPFDVADEVIAIDRGVLGGRAEPPRPAVHAPIEVGG